MDASLIYERLKALSGGLERSMYRDISKAFEEVVRYNENALDELKQSLHKELRDVSERFYLYGAVAAAGDVPIVNDFLFSMDDGQAEGSIATIFCPCSRSRMKEIFGSSQELIVETDEGEVQITAQIRPCRRYQKKIDELQNLFYENGIYWRTPYLPYVDRFGDVFCGDFNPDMAVRSVRFKSGDIPVGLGLIPLWNVEPISLKCTVFPIPAMDERNFRHTLRLPFWQDGYVVRMEQAVKNVFMSEDGLEVISEEKLQKNFDLYRIAVHRDIKVPHYPLTSNIRRMRHIDRQADNAVSRIRTKAEIGRIVTSYEAADGLELAGIEEGGQGSVSGQGSRYQFVPKGREKLLLKFRVKKDSFLTEDQVSFLVEEVQSYYPQFLVTGEISFGEESEP
ncbi:hypothetical protein D7X87_03130 [bacterium D16-54]|nr:hypothetical protein D7X87_03130 [bacterium D16-54]RKJ16617.1 hypothetical protein D7X65_03125 [bacterium D16-56]